MRKFGIRLLGLTTVLVFVAAVFAGVSFASGEPYMPCCGHGVWGMACCIHQAAMHCCQKFL